MKLTYSAKCYFSSKGHKNDQGEVGYEQRIVLLKANDYTQAIKIAELEASAYAKANSYKFLNFVEVFILEKNELQFDGVIEVYSLTMYDDPDDEDFLDNYYLTGGNAEVTDEF